MKKDIRFIGLDVHAETIAVAVAEPNGEVRSLGVIFVLRMHASPAEEPRNLGHVAVVPNRCRARLSSASVGQESGWCNSEYEAAGSASPIHSSRRSCLTRVFALRGA